MYETRCSLDPGANAEIEKIQVDRLVAEFVNLCTKQTKIQKYFNLKTLLSKLFINKF